MDTAREGGQDMYGSFGTILALIVAAIAIFGVFYYVRDLLAN